MLNVIELGYYDVVKDRTIHRRTLALLEPYTVVLIIYRLFSLTSA